MSTLTQNHRSGCRRPEVAARIRSHYGALGGWPGPDKLPLVYNSIYNIGFMGLENLHPFDSKKYSKASTRGEPWCWRGAEIPLSVVTAEGDGYQVLSLLEASGCLASSQVVQAREATHDMLLDVHDAAYLEAINTSSAKVTELGPLALLPAALLRSKVLKPMRFMAGGTMLAAALAQERGWAINLGGGLHHAYHADGGGWCVYDDIYLAIRKLRQAAGGLVKTCMVIDLDVHQGNGYERDKLHFGDQDTYLVDVYNGWIYPRDETAKKAINVRVELLGGAGDETYLAAVRQALEQAFRECPRPDLVIYNAGTDILAGDPLGSLSVSAAGVLQRDELVWRAALAAGSPLVMLLSGGYTAASTPCIASSMTNLFQKLGLGGTGAGQREAAVGQVPATAAASEL
ncbi:hypothetical protein N2152v2_006284 [Parachlorella kessleri]